MAQRYEGSLSPWIGLKETRQFLKMAHEQEADAVILCTGYLHHFPFVSEDLKLQTH